MLSGEGMPSKTILSFYSLALAGTISAQEKQIVKPQPSSVVSGRVFCADTNSPSRKANVVLARVDAVELFASGTKKNMAYAGSAAETLLNGSFTIPSVSPGVYYVLASALGYISPIPHLVVPLDDFANLPSGKKPSISAPRITLQANLPVRYAAIFFSTMSFSGSNGRSVPAVLFRK
jgi:hypothetical protein